MRSTTTRRGSASLTDGALGLTLALAFWPAFLSAPLAPRWSLMAVAVPILLCRVPHLWVPWLSAKLAGFLLYALASLAWAPVWRIGLWPVSHLAIFCGLAIYAAQCDTDDLLKGLAAGIVAQCPLVILQSLGYSPLVMQAAVPAGLFVNRNFLGEAAMPLIGYGAIKRWPYWLLLPLVFEAIMAADRAAIVGSAAALWLRSGPRIRLASAATGMIGLVALTLYSPWGIDSMSARLTLLGMILPGMSTFGAGAGATTIALYPVAESIHCDALQLLYEFGIGAVPLFWIIGNAFDASRRDADRAALACLVAESLFSLPLEIPTTLFLAALLVGRLHRARAVLCDHGYTRGVEHSFSRGWPAPKPRRAY